MNRDFEYLEELIAAGQEFTYRRARSYDDLEFSKEKWTEWLTKAEMAVQTFAKAGSKAFELIREAKHLEVIGELPEEFYKSRESALSALRICARDLRDPPQFNVVSETSEVKDTETAMSVPSPFWHQYGKPIAIGVAAAVIGGLILALLL
jgi:hypothetical protein